LLEGCETFVDPYGVGIEEGTLLVGDVPEDLSRAGTKSVPSEVAVSFESALTKELRELTGCLAAHQVHLKKALLCMEKTEGPRDIFAVGSRDGGNAACVASHENALGEASEGHFTVGDGEAVMKSVVGQQAEEARNAYGDE
jgi:hypothetical protein